MPCNRGWPCESNAHAALPFLGGRERGSTMKASGTVRAGGLASCGASCGGAGGSWRGWGAEGGRRATGRAGGRAGGHRQSSFSSAPVSAQHGGRGACRFTAWSLAGVGLGPAVSLVLPPVLLPQLLSCLLHLRIENVFFYGSHLFH